MKVKWKVTSITFAPISRLYELKYALSFRIRSTIVGYCWLQQPVNQAIILAHYFPLVIILEMIAHGSTFMGYTFFITNF